MIIGLGVTSGVQLVNLGGSGVAGGNAGTFYVGDVVQVQITGAPPNSPVSYDATLQGSPTGNRNQTGQTTDGNGNLTWTIGPVPVSMVGAWTENWYAASSSGGVMPGMGTQDVPVGSVDFNVLSVATGTAGSAPAPAPPSVTYSPTSVVATMASPTMEAPAATYTPAPCPTTVAQAQALFSENPAQLTAMMQNLTPSALTQQFTGPSCTAAQAAAIVQQLEAVYNPQPVTTSADLISGIPNWVLFAAGGGAILLLAMKK